MGIWEMRNPYYVEQIIHNILEYNNNKELRDILVEINGDKMENPFSRLIEEQYPEFLVKMQTIEQWEFKCED